MNDFSYFNIFITVLVTFVVGVIGNKVGISFAHRFGLFSIPSARRRHERPVPVSGGLWIYFSFLCGLAVYCWCDPNWIGRNFSSLWRVLAGMAVLSIVGFFDDRKVLRVRDKFLVQLAVCAFALFVPPVLEFIGAFQPSFGYTIYPLVLIFLIGITNAINFIDGADGLLSSALLIFFSANLVRGYGFGDLGFVPVLMLLMIPAVFSFLVFNWRPAKIFMGDTGSLGLGFLLVICCISVGPAHGYAHWRGTVDEAVSGILQLGYPILDLLWVITKRLRRGFSPFRADQNHLHHGLIRLGFSVKQCVLALGLLNICFQITSIQVITTSLAEAWPTVAIMLAMSFMLLSWIVNVDRWKSRALAKAMSRTPDSPQAGPDLVISHNFTLLVHTEPLFEGQQFGGAEQAMLSIHSVAFMLESNCPKGTQILWQANRKRLCLVFPPQSVAPKDVKGLHHRIQQLINNWVEMFNVSLSATSLRVTIGTPADLSSLGRPQKLRLVDRKSSGDSVA